MMLQLFAALLPLVGGPEVKWSAPPSFLAGQPYKVHIEVTAPKDGTVVANWLFTPAAFTVDGKPLAKREEGGALSLPAGFTVKGDLDLAPYIAAKGEFKLDYAGESTDGPPVSVKLYEAAPAGLDFMTLPVEQLADCLVMLETNRGNIALRFWPDIAPKHVRNFLDLSYTKYYDGTVFHRVMPGFMIQGGNAATREDPNASTEVDGPRRIPLEASARKHVAGVLSMARLPDPNSASTQFFIMDGAAPGLDGSYSAFGETVSGLEVVRAIATAPGAPIGGAGGTHPSEPQRIVHALVYVAKKP